MKKLVAVVLATAMLIMGFSVVASAYGIDPTAGNYYGYGYNNSYNNGNYGYGYNYYNCSGIRTSYLDVEYQPSAWFDVYAEEHGIVFHLAPTMPISRSDVFAPIGKAMDRAYEDANRDFSTAYGVSFRDFTWDASLYEIAGGLYQRGIMLGYPEDNTVRFPKNITRAELAKILVLTAKENGIYNSYNTVTSQFQDVAGHWAEQYMNDCNAMGLMVGKSLYAFAPEDLVTYEEFLAVTIRMAERAANNNGYYYNNYCAFDVEDVAYGISSTMDIDFENYSYNKIEDLAAYSSNKIYVEVGETFTLKVKATPSDVELDEDDIEWAVNKSSYLKNMDVDADGRYATGKYKALREGTVYVTAEVANDEDIYVKFTVVIEEEDEEHEEDETVYVSSIKVNPTDVELDVGESQSITATVYPTTATNKGLVWESHNTQVVTVSSNGKITAVGVGNTTVTCTAKDGSGVVATIDVTVTAEEIVPNDTTAPVVEITGADNIAVGKMATLTVKVDEENIANFEITEADLLGLTGGASINKIKKVSEDTYEITLMGVEVSSLALCIDAGVATDVAGNSSAESNEVIIFINSGEM